MINPADYPTLSKFRPVRVNENGFVVASYHYSCTPEHDPMTPEGRAWKRRRKAGTSQAQWDIEYEISYEAVAGTPCYPGFDKSYHIADIQPIPKVKMYRGWDPGYRGSACVWLQFIPLEGALFQIRVYREDETFTTDFTDLVDAVKKAEKEFYKDYTFKDDIDVWGKAHAPDGSSPAQIMRSKGIFPLMKRSYPRDRIMFLNHFVARRDPRKEPGLLVHPSCERLISGFNGLYRWPEIKEGQPEPKAPVECECSHMHAAFEYGVWNNLRLKIERKAKETRREYQESLINWMLRTDEENRQPDADEI